MGMNSTVSMLVYYIMYQNVCVVHWKIVIPHEWISLQCLGYYTHILIGCTGAHGVWKGTLFKKKIKKRKKITNETRGSGL